MVVPGTASRLRTGLTLALVLGAFAVLIGLGTWQVQRLHWKEELLARIAERTQAEPLSVDEIRSLYPDIEYMPVRLAGRFDHAAERHFFTTHAGQSGYSIYTPLVMDDGEAVFVNRGFVPYDRKDPATRPLGQVEGRVEITGLARTGLTAKPSWIVPDNEPGKNVFYWKDMRAMRETSGLPESVPVLAFFVDADATPNPGVLPVGGVTIIDMPNNHLQYAVTWYGLAGALAAVVAAWFWRRRRPEKGSRP